jgi:hypothetical protein
MSLALALALRVLSLAGTKAQLVHLSCIVRIGRSDAALVLSSP